jgi:hypothetical protein
MLFTACAIWMWCRWAKKKHEKKTYTLNVHRHNQATRIGWDERKSQQPCRHDGEGVFASLIPWQILRELRFRKERTIILLRLTKTDPNKWRMIWYTDIDCWYGFGVHISISILLIYILYIYIIYICNKCWTNCLDVGVGFIWDLPVWVKCYRNQVRDP